MSQEESEKSELGNIASGLLMNSDVQKSLIEMSKPLLEVQEKVLGNVINNQNDTIKILQLVLDSLETNNAKLSDLGIKLELVLKSEE